MKISAQKVGMFVVLFAVVMSAVPFGARAETTNVVNTISVTSHTGGSSASGGSVSEGTSVHTVDSVTTIDGEVVKEVHEKRTGDDTLTINYVATSSTGNATVETYVTTGTSAQDEVGIPVPTHTGDVTGDATTVVQHGEEHDAEEIITVTEGTSSGATTTPQESTSENIVSRVFASVARVIAYVFTLFS